MAPVAGSSAGPAAQSAANDYDSFAEAYSAANEASLLNAYYERPATLALAGNVARRRLGDDADLRVADLAGPLPYRDGAFDDVIASLVLHYLEDWTAPLAELRRVLKPGGRLIVSVDHPLQGHPLLRPGVDYFATHQYSIEPATPGGLRLVLWHRPLPAMISAFTAAGFRITAIDEPLPAPDTPRELLPESLREGRQTGFLCFMFFVLEAGSLPAAAALMT